MVTSEDASPEATSEARTPLSRERVLRAAIELADHEGIEALSMRRLGQELGVEAMSLYNHVENKEDLFDGMVDLLVSEIDQAPRDPDWRISLRRQALAARAVLTQHQWAPRVIETRPQASPVVLSYMDSIIGILLEGGISPDLTHHALHVLGSRILGFTQEMYNDSGPMDDDPAVAEAMMMQMLAAYPNLAAMAAGAPHDEDSILGDGCDDDVEFAFALELILDGIERLRQAEEDAAAD